MPCAPPVGSHRHPPSPTPRSSRRCSGELAKEVNHVHALRRIESIVGLPPTALAAFAALIASRSVQAPGPSRRGHSSVSAIEFAVYIPAGIVPARSVAAVAAASTIKAMRKRD